MLNEPPGILSAYIMYYLYYRYLLSIDLSVYISFFSEVICLDGPIETQSLSIT